MLRRFSGLLLGLLVLVLAGCAGSASAPAAATSGPPANVDGTWTGYAGVGTTSAPVTLTLAQTGATATGNISVGGRSDLSGPVVGNVQGNALALRLQRGTSFPQMTVTQDQITGVIQAGPVTLRRAK